MKKLRQSVLLPVVAISMLFTVTSSYAFDFDIEIKIDVSPNVLNILSNSVIVTVHTDIAYSLVSGATVSLNGLEIDWWKSDDRGNFVAKFLSDDVKDLDLTFWDYNVLTLEGETKNGVKFMGSQEILVINNVPKGKK